MRRRLCALAVLACVGMLARAASAQDLLGVEAETVETESAAATESTTESAGATASTTETPTEFSTVQIAQSAMQEIRRLKIQESNRLLEQYRVATDPMQRAHVGFAMREIVRWELASGEPVRIDTVGPILTGPGIAMQFRIDGEIPVFGQLLLVPDKPWSISTGSATQPQQLLTPPLARPPNRPNWRSTLQLVNRRRN